MDAQTQSYTPKHYDGGAKKVHRHNVLTKRWIYYIALCHALYSEDPKNRSGLNKIVEYYIRLFGYYMKNASYLLIKNIWKKSQNK